jgi:hypothetical protein
MSGGAEPKYSLPSIAYSSLAYAPAPRMLPVCGNPGIGTACNLKVTVGVADAAPGRASPRTATQMDALRIMSFPSFYVQVGLVGLDPTPQRAVLICRPRFTDFY